MPAVMPSRARRLFGTDVPDGKRRTLTAGPLTAVFDNGALRHIRCHGAEAVRGIAYLVRDRNWGTTAPLIEHLRIRQGRDRFKVTYTATCRDAEQALRYDAVIEASAMGVLRFAAKATPLTNVTTNRTGFVVLHPLEGVVGAPVTIVHTDGRTERSRFPKAISPGQPVFAIRSLRHTVVPGVTATVLMEGNTFEMEDHRNWMDASYKTYVCSLLDPWPYTLKQGECFEQSITVNIAGKPKARPRSAGGAIAVTLGGSKGRMPAVGIGVPMEEAAATRKSAALLAAANPAHLVCQIDGRRRGAAEAAADFQALKATTGIPVTLEVILPAQKPAMAEVAVIAADVRAGGLVPDAVVITQMHDLKSFQPNTPRPWGPSYEDMAAAVRRHFPGVPVGGGMLSYFTELNRKPVPEGLFDFVTHTVCPIVHAADDVSVMETLEATPSITGSARAMIGKTPYHLGPSGIACRDNPYGAAVAANPGEGRVCLTDDDPRQRGVFAAAWNLGLVAAAARGGINAMAFGATTGSRGIILGDGVVPAFHVLAGLKGSGNRRRMESHCSAPAMIATLAHETGKGKCLWLANLTAETRTVRVTGFTGPATLHTISAGNFRALQKNPGYMQTAGQALRKVGTLDLDPYAVLRIATPSNPT